MSARRVLSGARGDAAGRGYEADLDRSHAAYRALGLAAIRHLPVPTTPVPGNLRGSLISRIGDKAHQLRFLGERQGYDYCGVFGPNAGPDTNIGAWHGTTIAMEAKSSARRMPSMPIVPEERSGSGIKIHQLRALAEEYRDFGVCSVLCWRNGEERFVLLPDGLLLALETYEAGGRKSIPVAAFQSYDQFDYPNHPQLEDWLYPLRCWLEKHGRPSPAFSKRKAHPMQSYQFDPMKRSVTIMQPNGNALVVENVNADEAMIAELSRQATSAEDFADKLRRLGPANG